MSPCLPRDGERAALSRATCVSEFLLWLLSVPPIRGSGCISPISWGPRVLSHRCLSITGPFITAPPAASCRDPAIHTPRGTGAAVGSDNLRKTQHAVGLWGAQGALRKPRAGWCVVRCLDGLGFLIPTLPSGNQLWSCGPLAPLSASSFLPP